MRFLGFLLALAAFCSKGIAAVNGDAVPLFPDGAATSTALPPGAQPPVIPGDDVDEESGASITSGELCGCTCSAFLTV
jgi:hypothetical protein